MTRDGAWTGIAPIEDMRVRARGAARALENPVLAAYLESSSLRIASLDDTEDLSVRLTRFPELAFAHVHLPRARVEWPRDMLSRNRAVIVLCASGHLAIDSSSPVLRRRPGMFLLPPGDTPVTFELQAAANELLYISAPSSIVLDLDLDLAIRTESTRPELPAGVLTPLFAFATSMSAASSSGAGTFAPLRSAAMEIARSFARMIVESEPNEISLFTRTMRLINEDYADVRLSVSRLARIVGVSERRLHAVFAAEGTTVAKQLRSTRARAARELRRARPNASAQEIATAVGFGSVSSLYRALGAQARGRETPPKRLQALGTTAAQRRTAPVPNGSRRERIASSIGGAGASY